MRDKLRAFFHTLLLSLGMTLIFILLEQSYRIYNPILNFNLTLNTFGELILINFLILSLSKRGVIFGIYTLISILISAELLHFNYYGSWIFPLEFILFFTKFYDTFETFSKVLNMMIVPFIIIIVSIVSGIYILKKLPQKRFIIPYLGYVWLALVIFIPGRVWINNSDKGARPNVEVNPLRNAIETLGYLGGSLAVKMILHEDTTLSQKIIEPLPLLKRDIDANIVLIMGESLNRNFMSLYGYKKDTTPFLNSLKKSPNFIYKKGISSGVYTDVSLPSFFNMIYRPNGLPQIISTNTCLFKMAKNSGFSTHFFSSQSQDALSNIKSYLCTRWIDSYLDGSSSAADIHHTDSDEKLLEKLKSVNLNISNFIVLHQVGSHSPYAQRYPSRYEKFKDKDEKRSAYENSVLYTDDVIKKIITYLQNSSKKPTYIIFTADHGESVGQDGRYGHGHIEFKEQHKVPFFIYALHVNKKEIPKMPDEEFISHFEMSKIVAQLLGYDTSKLHPQRPCYVCGGDISGLAGFLEIPKN